MAQKKILIVDDEAILAMDLQSQLQQLGYEVAGTAASGKAAIQKAKDTQPDLVIMDISLRGDMDGVEAAKQILACFQIPVIFISGYSDKETLERVREISPFCLVKPIDERDLHPLIEKALGK